MIATTKSLFNLTAEDLMSRDVFMLPQHMSLRAAARMMNQARISGAPVVDDDGRCVGILSTTDLMRWMEKGGEAGKRYSNAAGCMCTDWQVFDVEVLPQDEVLRHMTTDVVSAKPETAITELARAMIDAHIHRILITDNHNRPAGIVASTDILSAVAYARPEKSKIFDA
jgi:CBS domain-containing protein